MPYTHTQWKREEWQKTAHQNTIEYAFHWEANRSRAHSGVDIVPIPILGEQLSECAEKSIIDIFVAMIPAIQNKLSLPHYTHTHSPIRMHTQCSEKYVQCIPWDRYKASISRQYCMLKYIILPPTLLVVCLHCEHKSEQQNYKKKRNKKRVGTTTTPPHQP